ncbi:cobalt ABC transporter ATP-binding protein [Candidatus Pacearchaeota archaeon]|nr:MAG: cobalt ABC transporter ATP-binding protein [Candidatus Pacearchaeota archaeon]
MKLGRKAIEIRDLSYAYPDGTVALSDINLDVIEGESIGIIGPNGAGKSTLLLHLNGLLQNNSGIKIFGEKIIQSNLPQIRRKVGLVFQDPDNQLFMPTVFDDVAFGPINMSFSKEEINNLVDEALKKVDMLKFKNHPSHHLSFGEKKRISLATVLSMKPEILVLDEPASNLDPRSRRQLIQFLNRLTITKIIATHDLDLVLETCGRVILLHGGRLVSEGDTLDILKDKDLLEKHSLEVPPSIYKIKEEISDSKSIKIFR